MVNGFRRGIGYAVGSARLLGKHRSLLLVALAFGLLNGVAPPLVDYATYQKTAGGRELTKLVRERSRRAAKRGAPAFDPSRIPIGLGLAAPAAPAVEVPPLAGLAVSAVSGPNVNEPTAMVSLGIAGLADFGLMLVIWALTAGGYLAVASGVALGNELQWRWFWPRAKSVFWRFLGLELIDTTLAALWGVAYAVALLRHAQAAWAWGLSALLGVPFLLFSLSKVVIIADDTRLIDSLRQSVVTIWRNIPVAAVVIIGPGCLQWLALALSLRAVPRIGAAAYGPGGSSLAGILAANVLLYCALSALGAWFCLAALLWYKDARQTGASP